MSRTFNALTGLLFPKRCANCGCAFHTDGAFALLCSACSPSLQHMRLVRCKSCGLALGPRLQAFGWVNCRHCRAEPQAQQATVLFDYTPPFDHLIQQFKYGGQYGMAKPLGQALAERWMQQHPPLADVLLAVPGTPNKVAVRGYNQAELLARAIGRRTGVPVRQGLLLKTRSTATQAQLGKTDRSMNQTKAFIATQPIPAGLRIALVDDVITTGATLRACTNALKAAGAGPIHWLAVCRAPE